MIIILLQQCPLGGFELGRFANELDIEAQRVTGRFGFECTLPVFEPNQEYRFTGQHRAETEDGGMTAFMSYNFSPFELFSFP